MGQLAQGRIGPAQFERRVRRMAPVIVDGQRYEFVADPRAAVALADEARQSGVMEWIDSGRARPLPRRRARSRRRLP
ncbi:MAG: hypothetical protein ACYC0E_04465 [Acidimicrobiales bacterium]